MKKFFVLSLLGAALVYSTGACNNAGSASSAGSEADQALLADLNANCYSCHRPQGGPDDRLAPPMIAVKEHYLRHYEDKAAFVAAMVAFVQAPSREKAHMPGAVEKFGLMPAMPLGEEKLAALAGYIYDAELERPKGYDDKHGKGRGKGHGKGQGKAAPEEVEIVDPLAEGQKMAMQTKKILGKNLMGSLEKGGPEYAMRFCNERAIVLTDSSANLQEASIVRRSDRPRNPDNRAEGRELAVIADMKAQMAAGEMPQPQGIQKEGRYISYYAITTNPMCLQCHGQPGEEIAAGTQALISELYPEDKATGYKSNELRGIWVVEQALR